MPFSCNRWFPSLIIYSPRSKRPAFPVRYVLFSAVWSTAYVPSLSMYPMSTRSALSNTGRSKAWRMGQWLSDMMSSPGIEIRQAVILNYSHVTWPSWSFKLPTTPLSVKPFAQAYITDHCPASRTTLVATRFRVAVICPIIQVPHCIRVFFYFVWFVFINHIFQFYYELCTYCNILDIYLS